MADTMGSEAPSTELPAETEAPAGTTEVEVEGSETTPTGDEVQGPTITVEIDGTEVELTADEVAKGYLRQRDYTQKTQGLAEQRRRLDTLDRFEKSLEADPQLTLQQLAEAYGVELTPAQQAAADEAAATLDPDDPVAQELAALKQWKQQVEQQFTARQEAEVQAQIDADLDAVKTTFGLGDEFDEVALLEFAVENNIPDLKHAHRVMEAIKAEAASKGQSERKKPPVPVEGGGGGAKVTPGGSNRPTLDEAFSAAATKLGFGS